MMRKIDKSEISYDGRIENVTFTHLLHLCYIIHKVQFSLLFVVKMNFQRFLPQALQQKCIFTPARFLSTAQTNDTDDFEDERDEADLQRPGTFGICLMHFCDDSLFVPEIS